MVFNSIEFAIFLPIVFLLYWGLGRKNCKLQNLVLLVASYVFYGWWEWKFLFLIAFSTICTFVSGLLIDRFRQEPNKAKVFSTLNIVINLLILGVFKYYNFFISSLVSLIPGASADNLLLNIVLPVGISFYTFQALNYSIDVYREKIEPTRDIVQFATFVSFFPQILSGPIGRASDLLPQYAKTRSFQYEDGADGLRQFLWGLFKKIVVADNCAIYVNNVWGSLDTHNGSTLVLAAILFSLQIYGDFSGYSDMAIGTARLFGIRLRDNFLTPYFSRNIAEFWRKWHISLTSWFRDYIYIPMGGSRCSKVKIFRNTLVIFLVSGLWHGANWTYVAWGAYHAILFLPLIITGKNKKFKGIVAENKILPSLGDFAHIIITFFAITFGWIIFRAESLTQFTQYISTIFDFSNFGLPFMYVGTKKAVLFSVILILIEWITRKEKYPLRALDSFPYWIQIVAMYFLILGICEFAQGGQSFIYFQY